MAYLYAMISQEVEIFKQKFSSTLGICCWSEITSNTLLKLLFPWNRK